MRLLVLLALGLAAAPALPTPDPVAACRAEHAGDPPAYVGCLEAALRARGGTLGDRNDNAEPEEGQDDGPTGMGAEQVRDVPQPDQASVQIVSTTYNARGLGTFRTEDGQAWRETTPSPERRRLEPDRQYPARIVRGKLGGYRMHVDGIRHMKTVERIE